MCARKGGKFLCCCSCSFPIPTRNFYYFRAPSRMTTTSEAQTKRRKHTHTLCLCACHIWRSLSPSLSLSLSVDIFTLWATVGWCKFLKCKLFVHTNTHVYVRNCSAYVARICVCQCEYVHNWFCYGSVANRLISGPLRIEICTALSAILFQNLHLSIKTDA